MSEEANLLRNPVFDDGEVVLSETSDDAAICVTHAEGGVDEMGFNLDDRRPCALEKTVGRIIEDNSRKKRSTKATPWVKVGQFDKLEYESGTGLFRLAGKL